MRALQIIIFLIPFQNHPLLSMNILPRLTPIKIVGVATLLLSLNLYFKHKKAKETYDIQLQGRLFLLWVVGVFLLSIFWYGQVGADTLRSLMSFSIFFIAVTQIVRTQKDLERVFLACVFAMAWSSIYMYKEYFTLRHVFRGFRPRGSFGDSNYYCIAALIVIPMGFYLIENLKGKWRWIVIGMTGLIIGGVIVAQSRGGILGVFIIFAFFVLNAKKKLKAMVMVLALASSGALFMPDNFWKRVQNMEVKETTEVAGDDLSNRRRVELPRSGWLMFVANPVFGVGPGNYKENSIIYNPILAELNGAGVAHNTYIEILGEFGIFGSLAYLGIFMITVQRLRQVQKRHGEDKRLESMAKSLKIGLYSFFVSAVFLSAQFSKFYWLSIFLCLSLNHVVRMKELQMMKGGNK